jgi:tungstate transport system permease protein
MDFFSESFSTALILIRDLDADLLQIVWVSVYTTTLSVLLASLIGIPLGTAVGIGHFFGRRVLITLLNTLMAMPTVVIGLLVYGMLSRQGPLGEWGLLFTPAAIIVGQTLLAIPIVANYTMSAINGADKRIVPTVLTLGGGRRQAFWQLMLEVRFGVMAAVIAGFGRVIAEVGVAMMLGGNIRAYTRTMTTAIALDASMGEFSFAVALGIVLMTVALLVNLLLNLLQHR